MKKLIIFSILLISFESYSQAPPFGTDPPTPTPAPAEGIPMTGGIAAFLLAGLGIGYKIVSGRRK